MSIIRHRRATWPGSAARIDAPGGPFGIAHFLKCKVALAVVLLSIVAIGTLGCGKSSRPGTAQVAGTITIGGQPLPSDAQANLIFVPVAGGRSAGAPVSNGRFSCDDAPTGKVKFYPNIARRTGRMITESDNRPYPEVVSMIAPKYSAGIELDITGDDANLDFDLEPAAQVSAGG
jgi:hypothetical protein